MRNKGVLLSTVCVAAFCATSAKSADLPLKSAQPIEYVRVCGAYGSGFFYIPGTDTCLRISGRARYEFNYIDEHSRSPGNGDVTGYRGLLRINIDARTATDYGTLRAFARMEVASRTGVIPVYSGTQLRFGAAFPGLGQDAYGRVQTYVQPDKAFVQFAGLTAGRASSFFDFYAHDYEIIGFTGNSDIASTNLIAYTHNLGSGLSATISMEDPAFRRQPVFSNNSTSLGIDPFSPGNGPALSPVVISRDAAGNPIGVAFADVTQRSRTPDFVGVLRWDDKWGSAQLSAAVHEVNVGGYTRLGGVNGGATPTTGSASTIPTTYGWGVQGGVKYNLPFITTGDGLYLQGAYAEGAMAYTGHQNVIASGSIGTALFSGAAFSSSFSDGTVNPNTGKLDLSSSWTVTAAYLHYWTPQWRSAFFGSYGEAYFGKAARLGLGQVGFALPALIGTGQAGSNAFNYNAQLRDNSLVYVGASLIWSPIRDLDIGIEGIFERAALLDGKTANANINPGAINGVPIRATNHTENAAVRMRVQRDF